MAMETGGMMGEDDDDDEDGDRFLILDDGDARGEEGVQAADVEKKEGGEAGKVAGAGGGIVLSPKNGYSSHGYHPFHSQFKPLALLVAGSEALPLILIGAFLFHSKSRLLQRDSNIFRVLSADAILSFNGLMSKNFVDEIERKMFSVDRTFKAECKALKKLRHWNLVKVITSCSSIDFRDYLHSQFGNPVVHCDLKPTNILLNTDLTAHVTDFGLTRFLSETTEQSSLMGIKGTNGYIPPEYGMGMEISTHGDVYSYGIVLTELFTGKRPTDSMFTGELSLRKYIKTSMPDHVTVIVDTWFNFEDEAAINQNDQSSTGIGSIWKCLASVLKIGVSCSADWSSECAERTSQGLRVKMVGHEAVEEETFAERTEREMGKNDVDILCLAI
ncbi:hypothetical protein F3Y22_tig00111758pilonHSYRG00331 [Hibiscus syriacus]|uniref:Protein kinase domain-containing protein n=1 Tax=Hibiscus syriacus TaxID=106335 RepID=A0A6A2Y203_HIBSY|nr:hypothetical protein F3Y22_tig00111758pilonHSYRG00331 [Hibiscus syriacus]